MIKKKKNHLKSLKKEPVILLSNKQFERHNE